jgi:hypothetical integral membrane protein (TIGR02206 family)
MNSASGFVLFGSSHVTVLLVVTGVSFAVWPLSQQVLRKGWVKPVAWTLALLTLIELMVKTIGYSAYGVPWQRLLPLQICDVNAVLCAIMLIMRSFGIYQVAYFWAMAGSTAALLTPDLQYDFPHPIFAFFFVGHALSIFGVLYATFVFGFRPRLSSVGIALLVTGIYGCVIMAMNYILGTNFLYLRAKPTAPSVLDYMGPWPWYVMGLVLLCAVACLLVYAPFPIFKKIRTHSTH